jgi:hypothetical protein
MILATLEENPRFDMAGVTIAAAEPYRLTLSLDTAVAPVEKVVAGALTQLSLRDIVIENPPLEDVIKAIYRQGGAPGRAEHAES